MILTPTHLAVWCICAVTIVGVIIRPWKLPEALWAVGGAAGLVLLSLISLPAAGKAVLKGTDVYLFLTGMMLLAELARHEGLFDFLAAFAVNRAHGSASRLFLLVYLVGTVVTAFLSNDATAVVLTPAVYAAAKRADAEPLPYLFICALIANAASFVLPISNPANLVVYGAHMPSLARWVAQFGVPSALAIVMTFAVLRFSQRAQLRGPIARDIERATLSRGGKWVAGGIGLTAAVLLVASGLDWPLGFPTFCAAGVTAITVLFISRVSPWVIAREISWSVLPLVAGLFVLVEAFNGTDALKPVIGLLRQQAQAVPRITDLATGGIVALVCNLLNNLPVGLLAGTLATAAHLSTRAIGALLVGVDLGPNLSVTGSLATILWLVALRREGQSVSAWRFLALGCLVMPPALLAALAAVVWLPVQ